MADELEDITPVVGMLILWGDLATNEDLYVGVRHNIGTDDSQTLAVKQTRAQIESLMQGLAEWLALTQ